MSINYAKYFDENGDVREEVLEKNRWLKFLTETTHIYVNTERLESVEKVSTKDTILYVMRMLDVLDEILKEDSKAKFLLSEVLKWSEVSKGGNPKERRKWMKSGYPLDIHNIASAQIYADEAGLSAKLSMIGTADLPAGTKGLNDEYTERFGGDAEFFMLTTVVLIKTHGLIGQCIRGEISVSHNRELCDLVKKKPFLDMLNESGMDAKQFFMILNECIIHGVSDEIWSKVQNEVSALVGRVLEGDCTEYTPIYRLEKLCPREIRIYEEDAAYFENEIFPKYELWYFTPALSDFGMKEIRNIFTSVTEKIEESKEQVLHINLKPLADNLYYDYEGKKHINVYKKRIIEKYLKDSSTQNVTPEIRIKNKTAFVNYTFTPVCEKLIDFCVEAERSGLLTFEKSIIVLYDMFGFRRDAFDRLNNEDNYLNTMNSVHTSSKCAVIDYAVGNVIVDVGSGGGVLLDRLESRMPGKQIIGTDISTNVIDTLNAKKRQEGHQWNVVIHNFVESPFSQKADSIIFSSILHEIYSYTDGENGRFDIKNVNVALKNAFDSLNPGGRILIRDGIKTDSDEICKLRFKTREGLDFFDNYCKDFEGLKDIPEEKRVLDRNEKELLVTGNVNFLREFMFTYTWGKQSYAHEVQEQFGYYTLKDYVAYLESIGAAIVEARELLEGGYVRNLSKLIEFYDENGQERKYPDSNCIIVAEKSK